jgi:hypothetical protein
MALSKAGVRASSKGLLLGVWRLGFVFVLVRDPGELHHGIPTSFVWL